MEDINKNDIKDQKTPPQAENTAKDADVKKEEPAVESKPAAEVKPAVESKPTAEAKAAADASAKEKAKPQKPTNCAKCAKQIKLHLWYYRNGQYYCNKRCWKLSVQKEPAEPENK